jgi:hypothetical protein
VIYPFREFEICKQSLNKLSLGILFIFSVCIYSFTLFTSKLESTESGRTKCLTSNKWICLVRLFAIIDVLLSTLLPFCLIFIFNCLFSHKLMKSVDINQSSDLIKSRDKTLCIEKIFPESKRKKYDLKPVSLDQGKLANISRNNKSLEQSLKTVSFSTDYAAKHAKKLKQLHNKLTIESKRNHR